MITALIFLLVIVSIIASVGYFAVTMMDATITTSSVARNVDNLHVVTETLKAEIRMVDGNPSLPDGSLSDGGYTTLPDYLNLQRTTPWGVDYIYCPYAPNNTIASGADNIIDSDGSTYATDLTNTLLTGNRDYVTGSEAPPVAEILGLIISPTIKATTLPRCQDVTFSGGRYTVANGVVSAIRSDTTFRSKLADAATTTSVYVAPTALGDGSGADASNAMTLQQFAALYRAQKPRALNVYMSAGTYNVDVADLDFDGISDELTKMHKLRLIGADPSTTILTPSTTNFILRINNVHLEVRNLTLESPSQLVFDNNVALIKNVNAEILQSFHSDIVQEGSLVLTHDITASDYSFVIENTEYTVSAGSLTIDHSAGYSGGMKLLTSRFYMDSVSNVDITIPDAGYAVAAYSSYLRLRNAFSVDTLLSTGGYMAFYVDPVSTVDAWLTEFTFNDAPNYGFSIEGEVNLRSSNVRFPNGGIRALHLNKGGRLAMNSVTEIGSSSAPVSQGVFDFAGQFVTGNSTTIYASTYCWDGMLFDYSATGSGASSLPITSAPDAYKLANRSDWTCN